MQAFKFVRWSTAAIAGLAILAVAERAEAQNLSVVPVPWVATDLTVPHQAYNGHATTFKAIARGGSGSWFYEWDFQGDGVYDFSATTANRYDLSTRFTYPNQAATTTFNAKIRVTSAGQTVTGTYPVRVFADVPADPAQANARQLQVMRGVAVDDGLWWMHLQMQRSGDENHPQNGAQITGNIGGHGTPDASSFLWALSLNGHKPAWPTAYIGEMPDPADNTQRWRDDPYAEDAARLVNYILLAMYPVQVGTNPTNTQASPNDESNQIGFYPEITAVPIFGTDDGWGLFTGDGWGPPNTGDNYYMGHVTASFGVSELQGFTAQVGDSNRVLGRRLEYVLQQMVDGLVWSQNDAGEYPGSWYYYANANYDDMSTSLWGLTGLWAADVFASHQGVIVPNIAKVRAVSYVFQSSRGCNGGTGGSYNVGGCDFTLSAFHMMALGWVKANQYAANDPRVAFPGYSLNSNPTLGGLRTQFNSNYAFITNTFNEFWPGYFGWNRGFVHEGDFERQDGQGCHYCMFHWQDAARAVEPEVVNFGNNDWYRQFSIYFVGNQAADGNWNWQENWETITSVSDSSGQETLRNAWALLVLSPDAIPPLSIGTVSQTNAPEGTSIDFNGTASDPGTGNPTYVWSFGNGASANGKNVTYAYPDNGQFNATLTSTSIGGVSTDTIQVTITNVAPTTNAGPDKTVDEGTALPLAMTFTDPGVGDTWAFQWAFGDATTANAQNVNKTYADNGVFNVRATVTDDDGGTDDDITVVTVNNVAPTITSTPGHAAQEAQQYSYTLTFTDPGTADTHVCSAPVRPAGSALVGCQLVWTPDFSQAIGAASPVRMCVTDDDGGVSCQDYTINVTFLDSDGDGLPDSWEISNFGNITSHDQFGDPDGDGMNNLQEFTNVTDPLTYDGPNAPTPASPMCGSEIASLQTILVANNAVDPQGAALEYEFGLYSDPGLTIEVAHSPLVEQGQGATTSWTVGVNLLENQRYFWRVRARDQFVFGPWSAPACAFFVNTVNEAPGIPRINSPAFGGQVNTLMPNLVVDNATDPDLDVLRYQFQVFADPALSQLVAQTANPHVAEGGAGTTTWQVAGGNLMEDHYYYWRARAIDPDGLAGGWSASGQFFVTTTNAPPEPPSIVSPQNGVIVGELRPHLVILNADDADLDPLVYDWDIARDVAFNNIIESGPNSPPQGSQNTQFTLAADLQEDTRYCWRVRSDDGQATSNYNIACFLVSERNDPPSVPTLQNPSDNQASNTTTPVFSWAPSTDPEDEAITYDIEVVDAGGTAIGTVTGVSGTVTSISTELQNNTSYKWRARATDHSGASSEWSAENTFTITAPVDQPEVVVNGGGCQSSSAPGAGSLAALGLGLLGLLRRRRK